MRPVRSIVVTAILLALACREEPGQSESTPVPSPAPTHAVSAEPPAESSAVATTLPARDEPDSSRTEAVTATPAAPPEPQPSVAAASPAEEQDASVPPFMPLQDAVPGEWAVYDAGEGRALRYEVTGADVDGVQTRVTVIQDGKILGQPAVRADVRIYDPLLRQANRTGATRTARPERISVAGRTWEAMLYEDRWTDEGVDYVRRTWVSPDAPCMGLLRMELQGDGRLESRLELRAWAAGSR